MPTLPTDEIAPPFDASGIGGSTALAAALSPEATQLFAGARTASRFGEASAELAALLKGVGVYDLGWRASLRITGADRVRWLNGMVTNTVKDLEPGRLNYTFLLNAQGRIQGDADIYALPDALLLLTDRAQMERLREHLDRFIIMDDVELARDEAVTALGLQGPHAADLLSRFYPGAAELAPGRLLSENQTLLAREDTQSYTILISEPEVLPLWRKLLGAGATPCGIEALEALRVLAGVPRYGADIHEKSLAQETGQTRALNFSKGCYLGQEIVERVRSRATIHRTLRIFALKGELPPPGTALAAADKPETSVGELTSIASVHLPGLSGQYALGVVRSEAAEAPLIYPGGRAAALPRPPLQAL